MPPSTPHIATQLRQLIYYNIDNMLVTNALFLAGRLNALEPRSSDSAYLLSYCYLLTGQSKAAWDLSRIPGSKGSHLGCSYIFAQACLDLGKYIDGINALQKSWNLWSSRNTWNKHSENRRQHLPDAAAVYCLQGKLYHAYKDTTKAVDCYVDALRLNPFLWDAFLGLCHAGANVNVPNIYKLSPEMLSMIQSLSIDPPPKSSQAVSSGKNSAIDPFSSSTTPRNDGSTTPLWESMNAGNLSSNTSNSAQPNGVETPVPPSESDNARTPNEGEVSWEPPLAPVRKTRTIRALPHETTGSEPPKIKSAALKSSRTRAKADQEEGSAAAPPPATTESGAVRNISQGERKRNASGATASNSQIEPLPIPRRSDRLFKQIRPAAGKFSAAAAMSLGVGVRATRELRKTRHAGISRRTPSSNHTAASRIASGTRKATRTMNALHNSGNDRLLPSMSNSQSQSTVAEKNKEIEAVTWILDLLSQIASGYFALTNYKCQDAINRFDALPQTQKETPWVLAQLGKAYYEQAKYNEAERYFIRVKTIAPSRVEDMEVYSTILWHLKNEVELAYLSHEVMDIDRLSPQSWCVLGNSFSLQSEHDQALKCFRRATQLDPTFAYAFTLQGHEYVTNEEHDKALEAYRRAISADNRHYNAWYGLGKVYEKKGKYDFAERHYQVALSINPTNSVLLCCIGLVLERMGDLDGALEHYESACDIAPQGVLGRLRKARTLMKFDRLQPALVELQILKDVAPDDANVHYLLGKLYKMMRDKANAIKHFTMALNLDPKAAQFIKDAMQSLEHAEEEFEDDDDEDMT